MTNEKGAEPNVTEIPLSLMLRTLRRELSASAKEARDEDLQFQLEGVELELKVTMSFAAGAEGGVKFWLVSLGAKSEHSGASTHTFKLRLRPVSAGERELRVADSSERSFLRDSGTTQ